MANYTLTQNARIGTLQFPSAETVTGDTMMSKELTVAAAKTGTLTTRTDADTGELTMAASHGITTGARLDVYWDGGSRRGMTVGTVDGNDVPIDGGDGDDLPSTSTAITAMVPIEEEFLVTGDNVSAIAVYSDQYGTVVFAESDDSEVTAYLIGAGAGGAQSTYWTSSINATNPLDSADVAKLFFSHSVSTASASMRVAILGT